MNRGLLWAGAGAAALILMSKQAKGAILPTGGNTDLDARLGDLADAISYIESGPSLDNVNHNPGNIKGSNGQFRQFNSYAAGRDQLIADLRYGLVNRRSSLYSPQMSFRDLAWMWVCGGPVGAPCDPRDSPDVWASTVATRLGVDVTSTVGAYLGV